MSEQGTSASFESSGGARIQRIPLEIFPGFSAYAYAVQKDGYRVLIDTGGGTEPSHTNLLSGLQQAGQVGS